MKALLPLLLICAAPAFAQPSEFNREMREQRAAIRQERAAARIARKETDRWARQQRRQVIREQRAALRESRRGDRRYF